MTEVVPIIEARGLSKSFGGVQAVKNVDFAVAGGELRCLIGPNGAGKSTFFKLLTGQYPPTTGNVYHHGVDITGATTHQIAARGIGIKTQVPSLFDQLSVHENLWLAARRRHKGKAAEEVVTAELERFKLTAKAERLVSELSHGERQWVELGVVLAGDPGLVLLDEPAAGLSRDEVERTAELIRDINLTRTMIVVEHDMHFIRLIAKTVTVFHQGAVLLEAPVDEVMRNQAVRDVYLGKRAAP